MDTRDSPEQAELRRSARQLARELGPATVADLDDTTRRKRLAVAVRDAGWLGLRDDAGDGTPLAGGVEAAIVAEALGAAAADVPYSGPVLAADLARRAGATVADASVVGLSPTLTRVAEVPGAATPQEVYAVDASPEPPDSVYVLVREGSDHRLGRLALDDADPANVGADLTRVVHTVPEATAVEVVPDQAAVVVSEHLAAWGALGLALTSADLVGVMRGVLDVTVAYAADRRQFGAPVGSFQAVQHLLAEAHCLMEGSSSATLHAAWAVDNLSRV